MRLFGAALASAFVLGSLSGCAHGGRVGAHAGDLPDRTVGEVSQGGEAGFRTNLGLVDYLTQAAVAEAVDSLDLEPGVPVTVVSTSWHEANWFGGGLLAAALAARGHQVRVVELASPPVGGKGVGSTGPHNGNGKTTPGGNNDGGDAQDGAVRTESIEGGASEAGGAPGDTTGAYADSLAKAKVDPLWGTKPDSLKSAPESGEAPPAGASSSAAPSSKPLGTSSAGGGASATSAGSGTSEAVAPLPLGEVVDLRILEFGVSYSDVRRKLLFGPLRFTRVGGVYLQITRLRGPSGEVHRISSVERHAVDQLTGAQRVLAEGVSYPFSKPDLTPPSLGRYIEPAVVVAIVGSLVYLFQTNQK